MGMGSIRNKRHAAGRKQQQKHQATKKRKQQQQKHRQDLRLTIALTKSGGVELKGRLKKKSSRKRSGHNSRTDQMSDEGTHTDPPVSSEPSPAQQQQPSEATDAEPKEGGEQETTTSPPPLSPLSPLIQGTDDPLGDTTSDHDSSTTVDASPLVTIETVPQHKTTKKVVMVAKSEENSDVDGDDDQQQQKEKDEDEEKDDEKDYEKLRQSDDSEVNGDGGLSVTCGENVARLYLSKLRLIARERVQSQCIRFEGSWLTPNEFQRESGREAAKDWKRTIRHNGLCLKQLLSDGIFDFSVSPPVCLCVTCAAANATKKRGHGATTNEEMEITARHPSSPASFEAATTATPDQQKCLISSLGSDTAAVAAAAVYRSGDGDKKEKRRRRSKQRPGKEKRKPSTTSSSPSLSSSACVPADDSALFRSQQEESTRKRKNASCQFDRPTAQLTDDGKDSERLAAKSDEKAEKSHALIKHLNRVTMLTDELTLELDGVAATADLVTAAEVDGMSVDATPVSQLHAVLEAPDGDIGRNAQEPEMIPKKKRRKKSRKHVSSIETSETQQAKNGEFVQADGHSFTGPKIPDERWSSKENEALPDLTGKTMANHVERDGCNVKASVCFQALSICSEVHKQTRELNEDQQVTDGKYEKIVDGSNIYEADVRAENAIIINPDKLDSKEMVDFTRTSPPHGNCSEGDYKKKELRRSPPPPLVSLTKENLPPMETESEGQTRETKESLDVGDIPSGLLSSAEEVRSQQPGMDGSLLDLPEIDSALGESIPTMSLSEEGGPSINSCLNTVFPGDRLILLATESLPLTPGVGLQSEGTSTSSSNQSTGTVTVSEAPNGSLQVNATTSRNPHLVAVLAELKQKKQLALNSGVKKKNEARQSVLNSDQSKGTGDWCPCASDAKVSFDVASRFLAAAANPSLSFTPPRLNSVPVSSSSSSLCQTQTLQQSSGISADLTQSMLNVISKAAEGQLASSVAKQKTKTTSGGRSESNRKRSCRPSTAEGKTNKALDGGKHATGGKDVNPPSIPLSLPSGLYGLSPSQLASLPFPASPYSLFPPYLFMGFPLQPLLPSCPSSDGKLSSFGMGQGIMTSASSADQPSTQAPPTSSRRRRYNQSGKSPSQKTRRGSHQTMREPTPAMMNPMAAMGGAGADKTSPATSDLLNSMMAFDLLRSRIGMSPPVGPGLDSPKSAPFYFPWLKPDPSKPDVLFGGGIPSSSSLLRTMTSDAKLQQAATRALATPIWSETFARQQHEQHPKRPSKTGGGDFRPFDVMSGVVDKKATPTPPPPLFSPDFKISRRRDKASLPSTTTDQKPFSFAASDHSSSSSLKNQSLPESHFFDDVGALDLSLK